MIQPGPVPHPVSLSSVVQAIVASASLPLNAETRSALITALNGMTGIKEERQDLVQQDKTRVQGPGKHAEANQGPLLLTPCCLYSCHHAGAACPKAPGRHPCLGVGQFAAERRSDCFLPVSPQSFWKPVCDLQFLPDSNLVGCEDFLHDLNVSDPSLQVKQHLWRCQARHPRHS